MGDWFERNRGFVVVLLMNLALLGGLYIWLERPAPSPIEIDPPAPTPSPVPTATSIHAIPRASLRQWRCGET
jgi:hypothetical protein